MNAFLVAGAVLELAN